MKAYLILANGDIFEGQSLGKKSETIGEAVFNTAMVGYMETLTDPCYFGQMVAQTFPLIGNYGAVEPTAKKPALSGYIVREVCDEGSNFQKTGELNDYLQKNNIAAIQGVDTRQLTRTLREKGVMNAMITYSLSDLDEKLKRIKEFKIKDAVKNTCATKKAETLGAGKYSVVVYDFGDINGIADELVKRDCKVTTVPFDASAEDVLALKPDGVVLSGGAGDPADNQKVIAQVAKLLKAKVPMFAIGLGHQILALAVGAKTKKLKYGHRGANQPVKDTTDGRTYITTQNHGYTVVPASLPEGAKMRFVNANDKTLEGIDYTSYRAFSVQLQLGSYGGQLDKDYLFDRFVEML